MDVNVQSFLVLFVTIALTIWYLRLLWRRRKLYIYSWNVPGPLSLPIIGVAYKFIGRFDDILHVLEEFIKNYPSIAKAWLGPHLVYSLKDPENVRKVLTSSKCLEKNFVYKLIAKQIGTGLLTAPVPKWKKHRKLLRPCFNQKILERFVEVFVEQATILTKVIQEHTGQKEMDISRYVTAMMMDVIGETAMGLKLNTQGGNTEFSENFDRFMEIATMRMFIIWYQVEWIWKLSPLSREIDKCSRVFISRIIEVIKKKRQMLDRTDQMKDLRVQNNKEEGNRQMEAFLDLILENPEFTEEELKDEVVIFMLAGMDTTAITTCYCFEMLGMHPEVQLKVYEEVMEVVGADRSVEFADLPNLKYLERVLKETLRLFPVAIIILRTAEEDVDLGHHVIPEGANILLSVLNIHRDPKNWPDPLKFNPDRFLPEEIAKKPPCSFLPFSYGARNCIGNTYAMMSLKSIVATTIRKYRVFSGYQSVDEIKLKTTFLSRPKGGFKVYVESR